MYVKCDACGLPILTEADPYTCVNLYNGEHIYHPECYIELKIGKKEENNE